MHAKKLLCQLRFLSSLVSPDLLLGPTAVRRKYPYCFSPFGRTSCIWWQTSLLIITTIVRTSSFVGCRLPNSQDILDLNNKQLHATMNWETSIEKLWKTSNGVENTGQTKYILPVEREPQRSFCLHLPSARVTSMCYQPDFQGIGSEGQTWVLMMDSQHFHKLSLSPAPSPHIFCLCVLLTPIYNLVSLTSSLSTLGTCLDVVRCAAALPPLPVIHRYWDRYYWISHVLSSHILNSQATPIGPCLPRTY